MKKIICIILLLVCVKSFSQSKNYLDMPYIETSAKVDTLVIPDKIYFNITITEKDTKGKVSVEELESKMNDKLKLLGISIEKQLSLNDLSSDFEKKFLKLQDILKVKNYTLIVHDAKIVSQVIIGLEEVEVSNVFVEKTEYSKSDEMILYLKNKAVIKAKNQAISMTKSINQKIGNAIFISDLSNITNIINGRSNSIQLRGIKNFDDNKANVPLDIEFEKIKIQAEVKAIFKLE